MMAKTFGQSNNEEIIVPLKLDELDSVFYLLAIGLLASFLLFIIEIICRHSFDGKHQPSVK